MYFKLFDLTKLVKNAKNSNIAFRCDINIILRKKSLRPPLPLASHVINGCRLIDIIFLSKAGIENNVK